MRNITVLLHDYWHRRESIEPVLGLLFPADEYCVKVTEKPEDLITDAVPDLLVSFKDVIENDQIPTPIWCDNEWTARLDECIKQKGMGFMAVHCGIADIPEEHFITQNILRAFFITHPPQCEVSFVPQEGDPLTKGVDAFAFAKFDEHYQVKIVGDTKIGGWSESKHGRQPALWHHRYGEGKVLGITPGHSYENLSQPEYLKLLQNCVVWCLRSVSL